MRIQLVYLVLSILLLAACNGQAVPAVEDKTQVAAATVTEAAAPTSTPALFEVWQQLI